MKIVAPLPSLRITGGIRRFLEIGNKLIERGYSYTIVVPDKMPLNLDWFEFKGKIDHISNYEEGHFDVAIIGPPDCLQYHYLAKRTIIIAIHDEDWVVEPYKKFLEEHPSTDVVVVNRRLKRIFPNAYLIEGGVNIDHFSPKRLRVGYNAQHRDVKNADYIEKQLGDLPHIELVPIKDISNNELPDVYRSLDYFVSWETRGGWSNMSAEALSCGVPVVTNGVNCEPFLDKVIVVKDPRDYFDRPLKDFSWDSFVDKLIMVIEKDQWKSVVADTEVTKVFESTEEKPQAKFLKDIKVDLPEQRQQCHYILDVLVKNFSPKRYLEVGVGRRINLKYLDVPEKVGIDIVKPEVELEGIKLYLGRSDDVFPEIRKKEEKFDLIFIDAYHEFRQCVRDFNNALRVLNTNGIIVIHDVWPFDRKDDFPYPITGKRPFTLNPDGTLDSVWCGDLWKMAFYISTIPGLDYATFREFPGYLVVWNSGRTPSKAMTVDEIDRLKDEDAIANQQIFRFMTPEEIVREIFYKKKASSQKEGEQDTKPSVDKPKNLNLGNTINGKKVLLACPVFYEKLYCWDKYLEAVDKAGVTNMLIVETSPPGKEVPLPPNADVIKLYGLNRRLNTREVLSYAWSIIFSYAEGYEYDYLWLVEADVIVEEDTLKRLIEDCEKTGGIVSALVRRMDGHPQAYVDQNLWASQGKDGLWRIMRKPLEEDELKGLVKVEATTFCCLLIPRKYFEVLRAPWNHRHYNHPDGFFFEILREKGIDVYVDCDVKAEHLQKPWREVVW